MGVDAGAASWADSGGVGLSWSTTGYRERLGGSIRRADNLARPLGASERVEDAPSFAHARRKDAHGEMGVAGGLVAL